MRNSNKLIILLSLGVLLMSACTYSVHQVPFSDFKPYIPGSNGKPIEAHGKQFVIMGFVDETRYVDNAYKQLQDQCVNGTVTGVAAKSYSEHGFFSWTNHIHMQGLCVQN